MSQNTDLSLELSIDIEDNYSEIIRKLEGLRQYSNNLYHSFGQTDFTYGWALYLSVVKPQVCALFNSIIPFLLKNNFRFDIPIDLDTVTYILGGNYGVENLGKVICIYPSSITNLYNVACQILKLTADYSGPSIPDSFHLGHILYTQQVYFNTQLDSDKFITTGKIVKEPIVWPFQDITPKMSIPNVKLICSKYYILNSVRENAKGVIAKAIYFKGLLIKKCIIKQGRAYMAYDDNNRDIIDRLKWQYEVSKHLQNIPSLPQILGLHEQNGCHYLAMEYIKGQNLTTKIDLINKNRSWRDLFPKEKERVLCLIENILKIIENIHKAGYIHRDLTSENFIVTRSLKIKLIDFELSWSIKDKYPTPPFRTGTSGYMSPEQVQQMEPTTKEDIFAIGALLFHFFTNLSPAQYLSLPIESKKNLLYLTTESESLGNLVAACLSENPANRPHLFHIIEQIESLKIKTPTPRAKEHLNLEYNFTEIISSAIRGIFSTPMIDSGGLWVKRLERSKVNAYQQLELTISPSLFDGVSGILWLLAKAKISNFDYYPFLEIISKNIAFLIEYASKNQYLSQGLYDGVAGIRIGLVELIHKDMLVLDPDIMDIFERGTSLEIADLSLSSGLAGTGLYTLSFDRISPTFHQKTTTDIVESLLDIQQNDGSWPLSEKDRTAKVRNISFSHGSGGIIWFLLNYKEYTKTQNSTLDYKIEKSLHWYQRNLDSTKLSNNVLAILLLIKSQKSFPQASIQKLIRKSLSNIPKHSSYSNMTFHNGLAGLGEMLIEANDLFVTEEYSAKLKWISNMLISVSASKNNNTEVNWFTDPSGIPLPGFFTGQSGIIHFLLRTQFPGKLSHPLWLQK